MEMHNPLRGMEQAGFRLKLNEDETVATVHVPGLPFEAFDSNDLPKITSLMFQTVYARFYGNHKPLDQSGRTFCDYAKLTENCYTFMASVELEVEPAMYDRRVSKWPLEFKFQLGYIGKSSLNTIGTLHVPSTGQLLLRNVNQVVYVSRASRQPIPIPDWWRDKYKNVPVGNKPLIVERTARPKDTFATTFTVRWSDTDPYKHANFASYVRYCTDTVHDGIRNGYFSHMNNEVVRRGLRKIRMGYSGENVEGEELTVHSWESPESNTTVCCEIEKAGAPVFHATLCYFNSKSKL